MRKHLILFNRHPITCIVFAVDGVVMRGDHFRSEFADRWDQNVEADLGVPRDALREILSKTAWHDVFTGRHSVRRLFDEALKQLHCTVKVEELQHYWMVRNSKCRQGVVQLAKQLRLSSPSARLCLGDNLDVTRAQYLWQVLGLRSCFEQILYSAQIGATKETAAFFKHIQATLKQPFHQILLVDSSPEAIAQGYQLGMQTFLFKEPERSLRQLRKALGLTAVKGTSCSTYQPTLKHHQQR